MQIYSSSMDSTIRRWDFEEKECVACIQLEAPVVNMVMAGPDTVVASLQCRGGDAGRLGMYCLKTKRWKHLLRLSSPSRALALSPSKQYIATFERHTLHIVQLAPTDSQPAHVKLSHTKRFTVCFLFKSGVVFLDTLLVVQAINCCAVVAVMKNNAFLVPTLTSMRILFSQFL